MYHIFIASTRLYICFILALYGKESVFCLFPRRPTLNVMIVNTDVDEPAHHVHDELPPQFLQRWAEHLVCVLISFKKLISWRQVVFGSTRCHVCCWRQHPGSSDRFPSPPPPRGPYCTSTCSEEEMGMETPSVTTRCWNVWKHSLSFGTFYVKHTLAYLFSTGLLSFPTWLWPLWEQMK